MGAQTDNHWCTIWLLADGLVLNRHFLPNTGKKIWGMTLNAGDFRSPRMCETSTWWWQAGHRTYRGLYPPGAEAEDGIIQRHISATRRVRSAWIPPRACHWIVRVWSGWCATLYPEEHCHEKAGSQRIKLFHTSLLQLLLSPRNTIPQHPLETVGYLMTACSPQEKKKENRLWKSEVSYNEYNIVRLRSFHKSLQLLVMISFTVSMLFLLCYNTFHNLRVQVSKKN